MEMSDLISPSRVIPRLRSSDKRHVLRELADCIRRDAGLSERATREIVRRSAHLAAFGPGRGVALPHAFTGEIAKPVAAFARLDPAVDFHASDGYPTDLVALLVSPTNGASTHLQALACLARGLRDRTVRERLRAAECRDSMYVALLGEEWSRRPRSILRQKRMTESNDVQLRDSRELPHHAGKQIAGI